MFASHIYNNSGGVVSDPNFNNVSLLLHGDGTNGAQNNTFLDSSTNNFTITRNGTPTQGAFSPYALNGVAYSPAIHGGGLYLNGTTDYLDCGAAILNTTGNFTIECWIYVTGGSGTQRNILAQYINGNTNRTNLGVGADNKVYWSTLGSINELTSLNAISENIWTHVCIVRNGSGSNNTSMYINGIVQGSYTDTGNFAQTNTWIGQGQGFSAGLFVGYISNLRITNTSVYTSNFTPPTSPVTLTSNGGATPSTAPTSGQVALLCDFTNAGIFDNAKKNVLTTVGNVRVSTSVVKFGTGSMYFNANSDFLTLPTTTELALSTTFTFECWLYMPATVASGVLLDARRLTNEVGYIAIVNGILRVTLTSPSVLLNSISTLPLNTWTHVAFVSDSSGSRIYLNGTQDATTTTASNWLGVSRPAYIGNAYHYSTIPTPYYGYIDDFRITKGVARYTANFTPPTQAFPNI